MNMLNKIKVFLFGKKYKRYSDIVQYSTSEYGLYSCYSHLVNRSDIKITSVSITQNVDSYKKEYLIVISYDYYV